MSESFKKFYIGYKSDYIETEFLFKTLKRQITAYLKESSMERFHSIFNKIFLLRKSLDKDHFYSVLLEGMNNVEKEKFMSFILSEGFGASNNSENKVNVKDVWEHQMDIILKKYRIK